MAASDVQMIRSVSSWETQLLQSVSGIGEEYRQPLMEIVKAYVRSVEIGKTAEREMVSANHARTASISRRIGICKGVDFFAEGHDLDEHNDEIAEMFGVNDE